MKRILAILLVCILCISFAACGKKSDDDTMKESPADTASDAAAPNETEPTEPDNSVIEFTDIVLVDDNNVTIELVNFYEEEVNWAEAYGGKQIEKCITFKAKNKTDKDIYVDLNNLFIGEETMYISGGFSEVVAGRTASFDIYVKHDTTPNATPLDSLDELYQAEGRFEIRSKADPRAFDSYKVDFSIDKAVNGGGDAIEEAGESDAANEFCGTWTVTEVKLDSGTDMTVEYMESQNMYSWSDWKIIVSKAGDIYLQTNNTSNTGNAVFSETGITAGRNVWTYENGKLVLNSNGTLIYFEKESDNQQFPELHKKDLVELLKGTWTITGSRTGFFTFTDDSASATINGVVVYSEASLNVLMDENRINLSETMSGAVVSMDLEYTYKDGVLSLTYSGDTLVKN